MAKFSKDPDIGSKAYDEARRMRAQLKTTTPAPTKGEQHVIYTATDRLGHDSARNN